MSLEPERRCERSRPLNVRVNTTREVGKLKNGISEKSTDY